MTKEYETAVEAFSKAMERFFPIRNGWLEHTVPEAEYVPALAEYDAAIEAYQAAFDEEWGAMKGATK